MIGARTRWRSMDCARAPPMRWLSACLVAAGISVFGLTAQEKLERPASRPNIVFLFADGLGGEVARCAWQAARCLVDYAAFTDKVRTCFGMAGGRARVSRVHGANVRVPTCECQGAVPGCTARQSRPYSSRWSRRSRPGPHASIRSMPPCARCIWGSPWSTVPGRPGGASHPRSWGGTSSRPASELRRSGLRTQDSGLRA